MIPKQNFSKKPRVFRSGRSRFYQQPDYWNSSGTDLETTNESTESGGVLRNINFMSYRLSYGHVSLWDFGILHFDINNEEKGWVVLYT